MVRGEGIYLWDAEGNRYIDGSSGPICVNIGHGVKPVEEAVTKQMREVSYVHSGHFKVDSVEKCAEKGFFINCTMDKVLRFLPPLVISEKEVDLLVSTLDEIFKGIREK